MVDGCADTIVAAIKIGFVGFLVLYLMVTYLSKKSITTGYSATVNDLQNYALID